MSVLSVVIPAYNEAQTITLILDQLLALRFPSGLSLEITVVNDASQDATLEIVEAYAREYETVRVLSNEINLGKSQSVRRGILATTGDYVVIQDADLEYNPQNLVFMYEQMIEGNFDVCYGNRFGKNNGVIYPKNFYGNLLLSFFSNLFTIRRVNVSIPDMEVCYKMVRGEMLREVAETIESRSNFGFEPEVTAKLSRYKKPNTEAPSFLVLPVDYKPRTYEEGKKMKAFRDGFKALGEIIKFNLG